MMPPSMTEVMADRPGKPAQTEIAENRYRFHFGLL
jgi:hypothetical protein